MVKVQLVEKRGSIVPAGYRRAKLRVLKKAPRPKNRGKRPFITRLRETSREPWARNLLDLSAGAINTLIPGAGSALRGGLKVFGFGKYRGGSGGMQASPLATMRTTADQGVRVTHHEYLFDVNSSTSFTTTSVPINPGLSLYPWLSRIASPFQKYILHGMVFYFKSTAANALNSTNTALGYLAGATQYNTYLPLPTDKTTFFGIAGARDAKPAEDNCFPVECSPALTQNRVYFIRDGAVDNDLAKYDIGRFMLATGGSQAAAVIGELHVAYDITLIEPDPVLRGSADLARYHAVSAYAVPTPDSFLANVIKDTDALAGSWAYLGSNRWAYTFTPLPSTAYLMDWYYWSNTTIATITYPTLLYDGQAPGTDPLIRANTTQLMQVPAPGTVLAPLMAYRNTFLSSTTGAPIRITFDFTNMSFGTATTWTFDFFVTKFR